MMWTYGPWTWFPMMWLFPLIFLIVLLFLFRGADWSMCGRHGIRGREISAKEILDRRYARGEINQEEYRQMKKELEA